MHQPHLASPLATAMFQVYVKPSQQLNAVLRLFSVYAGPVDMPLGADYTGIKGILKRFASVVRHRNHVVASKA
jgi:hypothetical protein